jgi:exosortase
MSKHNKKQQLAKATRKAVAAANTVETADSLSVPDQYSSQWLWGTAMVVGILSVWAYWPTLLWMESQWRNEPDYSHGYLVFPMAIALLYLRRKTFPGQAMKVAWGGLVLLVLAILLRVVGRFAYMDFLDAWSVVPWCAGLAWLFFGRSVAWWAAPGILFLILMTPMPYQAESLLSFKLQGIATMLSAGALQILGLAAVPDGNTIWLDDRQMMVEEACSGLRIFMGMIALGFFFAALNTRSWLDRAVIFFSCFPIAILVNVLRVAMTVLAFHWLPNGLARQVHDLLGILMILAGASLLLGFSSLWENLYRPLDIMMIQRRLAVDPQQN